MLVLRCNTLWPVMGMIWLMLWSASAPAQDTRWDVYNDAGTRAFKLGQYVEAEQQFKAALEAAEKLGPEDIRLAEVLENYAALLRELRPFASRFPWSPAAKMVTRAKRIRRSQAPNRVAHDVDAQVDQGGPGFWLVDENALFGSGP
jgi:hypothetical protein